MSYNVKVFVAIYDNPGNPADRKHWGLFIDGFENHDKILLHAVRSKTFSHYQYIVTNPRLDPCILDLHPLTEVLMSAAPTMDFIAHSLRIPGDCGDFSSQRYLFELLAELAKNNIIDGNDKDYIRQLDALFEKADFDR